MTQTGARLLGERYWLTVQQSSFGLVGLRATRNGSVLHLAGAPLLHFAPAELAAEANGVRCSYPIRGGLLARGAGGALVLSQSRGSELRAALTGFVPLLGARPYDRIQRWIHVAISWRERWPICAVVIAARHPAAGNPRARRVGSLPRRQRSSE
jgi:hypothetical protein